eukprot:2018541-Prymnesium_polylepis.1
MRVRGSHARRERPLRPSERQAQQRAPSVRPRACSVKCCAASSFAPVADEGSVSAKASCCSANPTDDWRRESSSEAIRPLSAWSALFRWREASAASMACGVRDGASG